MPATSRTLRHRRRTLTTDNRPPITGHRPPATGTLNRRALALTLLLAFPQDAVYALIFLSYMNAYLLESLHSSPGLPGYTLALYGATKLGVHPLAGRLLDRTSPRLVLLLAVAVQGGGVALLLLSHTLAAFLVAAVLVAIGSAATWPLVYETVARTQPPEARSAATGILSLVGYLGTGAGFAIGVLAAHFAPWRVAFFIAAGFVAVPLLVQGAGVLRGAARHPPGPPPSREERARRRRGIALVGVVLFLEYAAISSLAGVYGPYTHISLGLDLLTTTLLLAPAGVAAVLGLLATSRWSRPHRRFREMALLFAVAASGAIVLAFTPEPWMASLAAIPLAAGAGGLGPIVAATMIDMGGSAGRGLIFGTLMSIEGVGSVLGPAALAALMDATSPRAGVAAIGGLFALLTALTGLGFARLRDAVAAAPAPAAPAGRTPMAQMGNNPD